MWNWVFKDVHYGCIRNDTLKSKLTVHIKTLKNKICSKLVIKTWKKKIIFITNSEKTLGTVLVNYMSPFNDYVKIFPWRAPFELNECNIIPNNTQRNICGCFFSKKLTDVIHQSFPTKRPLITKNGKIYQHLVVMKTSLLII